MSSCTFSSSTFSLSMVLQDDMALEKRQEAIDLVKKGLMMDMRSVSIKTHTFVRSRIGASYLLFISYSDHMSAGTSTAYSTAQPAIIQKPSRHTNKPCVSTPKIFKYYVICPFSKFK